MNTLSQTHEDLTFSRTPLLPHILTNTFSHSHEHPVTFPLTPSHIFTNTLSYSHPPPPPPPRFPLTFSRTHSHEHLTFSRTSSHLPTNTLSHFHYHLLTFSLTPSHILTNFLSPSQLSHFHKHPLTFSREPVAAMEMSLTVPIHVLLKKK